VPFPRHEAATARLVAGRRSRRTRRHLRRYARTVLRVGLAALLAAAAAASLVAASPPAYAAEPVVLAVESIQQVVDNIRLWLVGILASWATLCLTVGWLRYCSGEPGEVEKARSRCAAPRSAMPGRCWRRCWSPSSVGGWRDGRPCGASAPAVAACDVAAAAWYRGPRR